MKRGSLKPCTQGKLDSNKDKPIKIIGISTSFRSKYACAKEDPISLQLLKLSLNEAEKHGAKTELIDLRGLNIEPCKECYSTCPAQCRFNEKSNMCDCYPNKDPRVYTKDRVYSLEDAYDNLTKTELISLIKDKERYDSGDDMHIVYKAMLEADGIIFAGFTNYYSRPALMQLMFSRLCALDGGVEKLWGDGKNLKNSIAYAKNKKALYNQRLYGKQVAFINCSKEGDSVTPDLMKACSSMGMNIIPFSTAYHVNWYKDSTHRSDMKNTLKDNYTVTLAKNIGTNIVKAVKKSDRIYGICSSVV